MTEIVKKPKKSFRDRVDKLKRKMLIATVSISMSVKITGYNNKRQKKRFPLEMIFILILLKRNRPLIFEAISSPNALLWKEAIRTELDSILKNQTWELVDLPSRAKPIGYKWIFKRKYLPDDSIEKYKARLVAKGFSQKQNVDYFDTFAPITRISSISILIVLTSIYKLFIHQMDIKTAFLNRDLEEEIYMLQPEGCITPG